MASSGGSASGLRNRGFPDEIAGLNSDDEQDSPRLLSGNMEEGLRTQILRKLSILNRFLRHCQKGDP